MSPELQTEWRVDVGEVVDRTSWDTEEVSSEVSMVSENWMDEKRERKPKHRSIYQAIIKPLTHTFNPIQSNIIYVLDSFSSSSPSPASFATPQSLSGRSSAARLEECRARDAVAFHHHHHHRHLLRQDRYYHCRQLVPCEKLRHLLLALVLVRSEPRGIRC